MIPSEVQARMKSQVWKAIAQNDLDVSGLDNNDLEQLIDIVVDAAMLEMDNQIVDTMAEERSLEQSVFQDSVEDEQDKPGSAENVLWEGRPFLSVVEQYKITDELIRVSRGMFGRSHENIELIRVQDTGYRQSMGERLFKLGDIRITSHDPHSPEIILRNIKDPDVVHDILRQAVREARKANRLSFQEEM